MTALENTDASDKRRNEATARIHPVPTHATSPDHTSAPTNNAFIQLKQRLDQLVPDNRCSEAFLANGPTFAPEVWRLIKLSLERSPVEFSDQEFIDERARVQALNDEQIAVLMRAVARFTVGEAVVEEQLAPLINFYETGCVGDIAAEYRALFIKIQQAEEQIHADFFRKYQDIVFGESEDTKQNSRMEQLRDTFLNTDDRYSKPFRRLFTERLPTILGRLEHAQGSPFSTWREIAALTCYHLFAEGVVAESAYFGFQKALSTSDGELLPTVLKGIAMIKQHESRHIGYGVSRLREIMDTGWLSRAVLRCVFLANLVGGLPTVVGIVRAVHREHPGEFPFPLDRSELRKEGVKQFLSRITAVFRRSSKAEKNGSVATGSS